MSTWNFPSEYENNVKLKKSELIKKLEDRSFNITGSKEELILRLCDISYNYILDRMTATEMCKELVDSLGWQQNSTSKLSKSELRYHFSRLPLSDRIKVKPQVYKGLIISQVSIETPNANKAIESKIPKEIKKLNLLLRIGITPDIVNEQTKRDMADLPKLIERLDIVLQSQLYKSIDCKDITVSILVDPKDLSTSSN